ncbi:MAG: hypothetical protein ACFHWX_11250 [Bacteroidota bacterium]
MDTSHYSDHLPLEALPLFNKGMEILDTVQRIADLIPKDNEHLEMVKEQMLDDALVLSTKVSGAAVVDLYDLKMEAAAIIRKAARDLMIQNHALEMLGFEEVAYFQVVRDLIEEYRLLFIDWVNSFDPWDYVIDRWGLFNPPGVGPFDKDPDDDLPEDSDR